MDRGYFYEEFLEKSIGFINPNNVEHLCSQLGFSQKSSSLMDDMDGMDFYINCFKMIIMSFRIPI